MARMRLSNKYRLVVSPWVGPARVVCLNVAHARRLTPIRDVYSKVFAKQDNQFYEDVNISEANLPSFDIPSVHENVSYTPGETWNGILVLGMLEKKKFLVELEVL